MSQVGKNLVSTIKNEWKEFEEKSFEYAPQYANTIPRLTKLIDLYWVDRYLGGDTDDNGWKRAFYNIVKNPTLVSGKQIDLDTKDVRIIPEIGQSLYPSWIYSRDLKQWMKQRQLGLLLNELVLDFPKYGSIIVKKAAGNNIFNVHLSGIAWEADQQDLNKSRFVNGMNKLAEHQLEAMRGTWDNIQSAINEAKLDGSGRIKIFDRFGFHKDFGKNNYNIVTEGGIVLHSAEYESVDDIYRKLDWDRIVGRGVGRGVVEDLMENQISRNRIEEFKNTGLDWTSKIIFQTRDDTFARNLLTEVDNGEVLNVQDNLTVVNNSEKNLPAYNDFTNQLDKNTRERTFAFPEVSGERPPAGTPLGTTKAQLGQAGSYYDQRREELGIFLGGIIRDWVIPEFKKERSIEHRIMLSEFNEDELTRIKGLISTARVNERIFKYVKKNGRLPDAQTRELIKASVKEQLRKEKDMVIPARFYDKEVISSTADVIITNEQLDIAAELTTLQTVVTLLSQNPAILDDPRTKKAVYRMMSLAGKNPLEFEVDELPEPIDSVGGFSSPNKGSAPRPNPVPTNTVSNQTVVA